MPLGRNRFTNPLDGTFYDWPRNHDEEEETGKTRNITRTAPTGNVGLLKTQGEDSPFLIKLRGKYVHRAQHIAMWQWFERCKYQTIWFTDFDGQSYEVQITAFTPRRVRKLKAVSPDPGAQTHYWEYGIEMEIYRFIGGDMATAGVSL